MKQKRLLLLLALLMTAATGAWAQTGVTKGSFSVSATKRVYFSKGNLQLVGENIFQFAENQWDYFGNNQSDNHRDLFCWGTGNNPNQTTGNSTFTDWGDNTYLQATLGKGWRTLTKDEFVYVFNTRASGSSVFGKADGRYTTATINTDGTGVNGFILFPDGITIAASEVKTAGTINSKGTVTQCTKAQWAALAEKGCVFLPAGGYFLPANGAGAGYGEITDYWSSTAADASKAYNLNFNFGYPQGGVNPAGSLGYNYGCSVRLVIDGYVVTMKDGVKDADKWTVKVGEGQAHALPIGGLTGDGSETVTLQYNGRLKVKGVKATSDAAPAPSFTEVTTFSELQTALSAGKNVKLMNDIVCTAEIEITSNGALTIDGNGKKLSTTSAIRAFKVGSSATVAFKDLTLTGFVSGGGPAINNSGTIVLDGCTISNCHVNNSNGGGAIENKSSNGKLYAINTTFSGNYSGEIGGAINNYMGSLYMSGCTFTNNYTTKSNAYYGGAIGINRGSEVRLINCVFSGNKYGTATGTNDIGVYSKPTNYTIAGCTGATIASDDGDITTNTTGTATLDYSDLSNISFTYNAE